MPVESGDAVRLDYVGRLPDESVFATSRASVAREAGLVADADGEDSPLSFIVGRGDVIAGLEAGVRGMTVGEERTIEVPPEQGYGEYDPDRVREYDPETFAEMVGHEPEVGDHVEAKNGLHGDVTAVSEASVQVDFNHELAGRTLQFELHLLAVE